MRTLPETATRSFRPRGTLCWKCSIRFYKVDNQVKITGYYNFSILKV